jgi:phospholipase/lecithinase/hemolysin
MKAKTGSRLEGSTIHLIRGFNGRAVAMLTAMLLVLPLGVRADSAPFSRIFVFGDSLSDTGNFFVQTGYPPAPYANGRFSNGPLWVEQAASGLQMTILPGDNYAIAGATTGRYNVNHGTGGMTFPGLQGQLDSYQADHSIVDAEGALFVVWAGANDFFAALATGMSPQLLISNGVYNTGLAIVRLKQSGAQHILVLNVPDLGVTPYARGIGMAAPITQLCAAYNVVLKDTLDTLAANGIPTIQVDALATLDAMAFHPADFGFTNATQAFLTTGGHAEEFLFWDAVHPTTRAHTVLADEALNSLLDYYSPREGRNEPEAGLNGLRGLVRARGN